MVSQITGEIIIQEGRELSLDSITGILNVARVHDVYDIMVKTLEPLVNPATRERVVDPDEVLTVYELNQIRDTIEQAAYQGEDDDIPF